MPRQEKTPKKKSKKKSPQKSEESEDPAMDEATMNRLMQNAIEHVQRSMMEQMFASWSMVMVHGLMVAGPVIKSI